MKIWLSLIIIFISIVVYGQDAKLVSGRVYTLNDLPVCGIKISAKNSLTTAVSDSFGHFNLMVRGKDKLTFDSKMFKKVTKKVDSGKSDSIIVALTFPPSEENVDIAIGYGYISERNRTTAVQYLSMRENDYYKYQDIYEAIKANFSNVQVSGDCIVIRGPSSLQLDNCALLIVDGIETSSIAGIPVTQIKRISIIKDGSAAIYGSRGGNGVVLIELRRGYDCE